MITEQIMDIIQSRSTEQSPRVHDDHGNFNILCTCHSWEKQLQQGDFPLPLNSCYLEAFCRAKFEKTDPNWPSCLVKQPFSNILNAGWRFPLMQFSCRNLYDDMEWLRFSRHQAGWQLPGRHRRPLQSLGSAATLFAQLKFFEIMKDWTTHLQTVSARDVFSFIIHQ